MRRLPGNSSLQLWTELINKICLINHRFINDKNKTDFIIDKVLITPKYNLDAKYSQQ